ASYSKNNVRFPRVNSLATPINVLIAPASRRTTLSIQSLIVIGSLLKQNFFIHHTTFSTVTICQKKRLIQHQRESTFNLFSLVYLKQFLRNETFYPYPKVDSIQY